MTTTSDRTEHAPGQALDVDALLATLTLEEKASLLSGLDFWNTQRVERDGHRVPESPSELLARLA